jgi:hypothetical protein
MRRFVVVSCVLLIAWLIFMTPLGAVVASAVRGEHGPTANVGYLGTGVGGVYGTGFPGVRGEGQLGVLGVSTSETGAGVEGDDAQSVGVSGYGFTGVFGTSNDMNGTGVYASTDSASSNAVGLYAYGLAPALAGLFEGNVTVLGTLTKSAGSFKIDHPLDPANKYLSHSFVESPDMKNIYDGIATLDRHGEAIVTLPAWFEALNKDFRYQLTCIGENAPVFIAEKIHDNTFRIGGGYEGMEVSWQVTGSRRDRYAEVHPIPVEELKPISERGRYLHPELYFQTGGAPMPHRARNRSGLLTR